MSAKTLTVVFVWMWLLPLDGAITIYTGAVRLFQQRCTSVHIWLAINKANSTAKRFGIARDAVHKMLGYAARQISFPVLLAEPALYQHVFIVH